VEKDRLFNRLWLLCLMRAQVQASIWSHVPREDDGRDEVKSRHHGYVTKKTRIDDCAICSRRRSSPSISMRR
jgi:hypothetical protein